MAHNITLAALTASAIADAVAARCDGGTLKVYDGAQPATADTAIVAQTLLATCTFATPTFLAAVAGVATAHAITQDASADATGTAAWFRILDSTGAAVMDGTVGVGAKGSHEFVIRNIGAAPLELTKGATSCTCTVSDFEEKEGGSTSAKIVPPGESTKLKRMARASGRSTSRAT